MAIRKGKWENYSRWARKAGPVGKPAGTALAEVSASWFARCTKGNFLSIICSGAPANRHARTRKPPILSTKLHRGKSGCRSLELVGAHEVQERASDGQGHEVIDHVQDDEAADLPPDFGLISGADVQQ